MKKITKIFTTIVVAFAAYSCVADATEDLGVQLGSGEGLTTITLSLGDPDTKVQFGTKDGDTYPLRWNVGDVIVMNKNYPTKPLTESSISEDGRTATFTLYEGYTPTTSLRSMLCPNTSTSGTATQIVYTIPAEQKYYEGNIDPMAMVLYGSIWLEEGVTMTTPMKPTVGVLRIAVKGNGEVLKGLTVEAPDGSVTDTAIAGENIKGYHCDKDNNYAEGTIYSISNKFNLITMVLPEEGLILGEEEQAIYVAVRALPMYTSGLTSYLPKEMSYGKMKVTLTDAEGNQMAVTFDTTKKPIKAGVVREFTPIVFTPNVGNDEPIESSEITIDSEAALVMFAKNAASYTKATVTKELNMNNVSAENLAYFPIENFGAYEFDGGNFEISNLTTPLFGTTEATIKNVKLTNVNINETTRAISGAIACQINGGSLENCSATGALTVSDSSVTDTIQIGGIVGVTNGTTVTNCTNDVDITIKSVAADVVCVGGVACSVSGAVNGAVNTGNFSYEYDNGNTEVYVGGVFCSSTSTSIANITNGESGADDKGKISINKTLSTSGKPFAAGLICLSTAETATYTNCNNYGDIVFDASLSEATTCGNTGGLAGLSAHACGTATWDNCHNYGNIEVAEYVGFQREVDYGGLIATYDKQFVNTALQNVNYLTTATHTFKGCSNSGNISIKGALNYNGTAGKTQAVGGLVGRVISNVAITIEEGFVNSGDITFSGTLNRTGLEKHGQPLIGGIIGFVNNNTFDMSGWSGTVANTGAITCTAKSSTANYCKINLGGVIGSSTSAINYPVINTGKLVMSATNINSAYVGGIVGNTTSTVTGARCYCQINANAFSNVGWIMGSARSATVKATNCAIGGYTLVHDIENEIDQVVPAFKISNYYDYIYGGTTDWTGVTDYDGCGYLSSKDAEVEYPAATE